MSDAPLTPAALQAALAAYDWPATWPAPAQVAAALAGYPVSAVAVATEPPAQWEEEIQAADPECPLAPKLILSLAMPDSKSQTVALALTFAAHLAVALAPTHCERAYQDSLWTLDWTAGEGAPE
jgi:hypothetical protein